MSKRRETTDASEILRRRYLEGRPERQAAVEAERVNAEVAQMIHDLRKSMELTQEELADLVGTTQSAISRLEDADYNGHSLSMLQRISQALNQKLTVVMTAKEPEQDTLRYVFRSVLRDLRRAAGLSIDALAQKTGIERAELIAAERVAGYRPTPLMLRELSDVYGVADGRLAALAGAFGDMPKDVAESAQRYAAQSESFAKLTREEKKALDQFVEVLKSGA